MVGSRVYIGGLPYGTSKRDLERFFRGFGRMRDILIKSGYGFVEFDDCKDADDAVYELNGKRLLGERVTVEIARGTPRGRDQWGSSGSRGRDRDRDRVGRNKYGPPTHTGYRIIVENLSSRVSWQDLKDYMRQAGEVTYADAHKRKNEGVVEFASYSDMKNAIEKLDDTELNGRRIKVFEDKSARRSRRSTRSSSRSRSRSRSGSKSKSRSRSRSKSPKRRRSNSADDKGSRSRSRSAKRSRSRSRSASKETTKRPREDRSRSKEEGSKSRSRSKENGREENGRGERSKSPDDRSRSRSKENERRSRSASREQSKSREPSKERSKSKSRSRSKSN
ncbi:hypothetical protein GWI33_013406 [Rhynchophorus ferrugineus]|uniref:RRM domain-containing protein n=1 Tax=Rhynchophorus ferrugineus TaxID=354439 RepID=A0A834I3T5_RHYFE|nr:hypothetical protein GWI33_013406 [Rhynchophorus ferrugineus]